VEPDLIHEALSESGTAFCWTPPLRRSRRALSESFESKGVSQETSSSTLGRPITYIGKVELGSRRLDIVELAEICDALEGEPERLIAQWRRLLGRF
jgi:hypothetical protein